MGLLYRRGVNWRLFIGPLLTLAVACVLLLLVAAGISVPIPGAIMVAMIFASSCIGGAPAGYLSAAAAVGTSAVLLSEPALSFIPAFHSRLQIIIALALVLPLLIGHLRARAGRRLEQERAMRERAEAANRELRVLRTKLVHHAQELERLATTDDLTGLCNRRHFFALAEEERRRHLREGKPLALLIFDIDLFKSVNDRFGHNAGDMVIRHVVDVCRRQMGSSDILARIGGEEFVLLLIESGADQALARAESMRKRLEDAPLAIDGTYICVTVSIGVCEADPRAHDIGDLMNRADQALYQAKRDGRNRVRYARPLPPPASGTPSTAAAA